MSQQGPLEERAHGEQQRWRAMTRSSRRLRTHTTLVFGEHLRALVLSPPDETGLSTLLLFTNKGALQQVLESEGEMPLPPYLQRPAVPADRERYQTRFAARPGAIAAPTAGLHFSDTLLQQLEEVGVQRESLTLHVGLGTFKPVKSDDLDEHPMHAEWLQVSAWLVDQINAAKANGRPVIAVGTTVVRALESAAADGTLAPFEGETRLLIQPGYKFRVVDGLITNFHLPGSTLLALVYAFAGVSRTRSAYALAVREDYRFYSYGDAMYIPVGMRETP